MSIHTSTINNELGKEYCCDIEGEPVSLHESIITVKDVGRVSLKFK
jgi:hypothetical protein